MKDRRLFSRILFITLALIFLVGISVGAVRAENGDPPSASLAGEVSLNEDVLQVSPQGGPPLTDTFTFQGRLTYNGAPANGYFDFQITIWDARTGGSQIASAQILENRYVRDGLFSFQILPDKPMNQIFNGGERWIQVKVRRHGVVEYTTFPRQPFAAAPYAWSLRPGATVMGYSNDTGINVQNYTPRTSDHPIPKAIFGYGRYGHGVYGETMGNWSNVSGVYGVAHQDHANGVNGVNTAGGYGVRGESKTGVGVVAKSESGNLIEAWDTSPNNDRRFYVSNSGYVYADHGFHTPAADFAEMLPARGGLEPGDVLVIGPDGKLARCSQPFQSTVVGVYSTQPGFVGGSNEALSVKNSAPLAVVGIVPVKVSAENGAIQPGDLLVASATPGHAMKAGPNPPVGTVIGKALESLDGGVGVIKMLVMPH